MNTQPNFITFLKVICKNSKGAITTWTQIMNADTSPQDVINKMKHKKNG